MPRIMFFPAQLSPAFMLFREKGELLFVSSSVSELTGFKAEKTSCLGDCLAHLFGNERAEKLVRFAAAQSPSLQAICFKTEFCTASGQMCLGAFQLHVWQEEPGDRRLLLNFLPCPTPSSGHLSQETWSGLAQEVQDRLNEALACLEQLQEGKEQASLDRVELLLTHSQKLLLAAQNLDLSWSLESEKPVVPTQEKMPETMVNV